MSVTTQKVSNSSLQDKQVLLPQIEEELPYNQTINKKEPQWKPLSKIINPELTEKVKRSQKESEFGNLIQSLKEKESERKTMLSLNKLENSKLREIKITQSLNARQNIPSADNHPLIQEPSIPSGEAKQLIDQLVVKIKFLSEHQDRDEARIILKPEHLGTLRLHLSIHKTELTLGVHVSNSRTGELIQKNLAYLKASLEKEGLFLRDFSLSLNQNPNFGRGQRERNLFLDFGREPLSFGLNSFTDEEEDIRLSLERHYVNYLI